MNHIKDYLAEHLVNRGLSPYESLQAEVSLCDASELFENDIPAKITDRIIQGNYYDFIGENFKSYDYDIMLRQLEKKFKDDIIGWRELYVSQRSKIASIVLTINNKDLLNNKEFYKVIQFFGYFVTDYSKSTNNTYIINLEPDPSPSMQEYLYDDCHGICYHFTNKMKAKNILKTGLRDKMASYRTYPERIYVYMTPNRLDNESDKVIHLIKKVVNGDLNNNISILKINLNKPRHIHIPFYKDTAMNIEGCAFTYNHIPPECITQMTVPSIENAFA